MSRPFSVELQEWLDADNEKTIDGLGDVFGEKSFALAFVFLMASSALPLPTGGITQVFEIMTMLLALELVAQKQYIWLPKRWRETPLGENTLERTIPFLIRMIRKIEKFSRPRFTRIVDSKLSRTLFGVAVFFFAGVSLTAIPFSFLDTLPSMGIIAISLGVILEDMILVAIGLLLGSLGSILSIGFSAEVIKWIKDTF